MATTLVYSLNDLKGVGPAIIEKLARLGIHTPEDLLFHLPRSYQDRTRVTPIGHLVQNQSAVIDAEVATAKIAYGRKRSLVVTVKDSTGVLTLRFFHFAKAQLTQFAEGRSIRIFGEPRRGPTGLEIVHPEYKVGSSLPPLEQQLTPIYPAADGLSQTKLRQLIDQVIGRTSLLDLSELLPEQYRQHSLVDALLFLHHPPSGTHIGQLLDGSHPAIQRLALEELAAHHMALKKVRAKATALQSIGIPPDSQVDRAFIDALPFSPTGAQARVHQEILGDLEKPVPMMRLVQGDVGSGKTLVAARAIIQVLNTGLQAAMMAPTEILAEQHFAAMSEWLTPLGFSVALLTGRTGTAERRAVTAGLIDGSIHLAVGTHALFQDSVTFKQLALAVIDEQHRFGVEQRAKLREKGLVAGIYPHLLLMTATPIPRTLAMTFYADLDCSIIDELPPGRSPVNTVLIDQGRRDAIIERIGVAIANQRQIYWVCTLIEESEDLDVEAAEATTQYLIDTLPSANIGLIHGKQTAAQKFEVMTAFKEGELDLLVATTVIEVGVDVPNASLMIIENPERLGLSQLHQLRGRVGRGAIESHCVLLYGSPLGPDSKHRLQVMRDTNDGFIIAEEDLKLRGSGEILGSRQTGEVGFKIADLSRDMHLLTAVQQIGEQVTDSTTVNALIHRWVGSKQRFAQS